MSFQTSNRSSVMIHPNCQISSLAVKQTSSLRKIFQKLEHQISIKNLSTALRQYCIQQKEQDQKNAYLNFFLICESKLNFQSNCEWKRVFEAQIRNIHYSVSITKIIQNLYYRKFLKSLKKKKQILSNQSHEVNLREHLENEMEDIAVSESVKSKTNYFYKWCQYIENIRCIKMWRQDQVENIKKAKIFNHYTSKFNTFSFWKKVVKKQIIEKKKAESIAMKVQSNLLRNIFLQIQQKFDIQEIQANIEKIIITKLTENAKEMFIRLLKKNQSLQQNLKKAVKATKNIYFFRFSAYLTKNLPEVNSKMKINLRIEHQKSYGSSCLEISFKTMKQLLKEKKKKDTQLKSYLRNKEMKSLVEELLEDKRLRAVSKNIQASLQVKTKKSLYIKLINLKVERQNEWDGNESMIELRRGMFLRNLQDKCKSYKQSRATIKGKVYQTRAALHYLNMKQMINGIKLACHRNKFLKLNTYLFSKKIIINNFIKQIVLFKKSHQHLRQIKSNMQSYHQQKAMAKVLSSLKCYKFVKINEQSRLQRMVNVLENALRQEFFGKVFIRSQVQAKCLELVSACEYIAKKNAFIRILQKTITKKLNINAFFKRKDSHAKHNLLKLLQLNVSQRKDKTSSVRLVKQKFTIKYFFVNLARNLSHIQQSQQICIERNNNQRRRCLQRFRNKQALKNEELELEEKFVKIVKKFSFKAIRFNYISGRQYEGQVAQNIRKIKIYKMKNQIKYFCEAHERHLCNQKEFQQKYQILESYLIAKYIKTIRKNSFSLQRNKKCVILSKQLILKKNKAREIIRSFEFAFQQAKLQYFLSSTQKSSSLIQFIKIIKFQKCRLQAKATHAFKCKSTAFKTIINRVKIEKNERENKQINLSQTLNSMRYNDANIHLFKNLASNFKEKQNFLNLSQKVIKKNLQVFVKNSLQIKYEKIQNHLAIKNYASLIKKKALKGIKKVFTQAILKENRLKTENSSILRIERSMDQNRKKNKLLETIDRFNLSQVHRNFRS